MVSRTTPFAAGIAGILLHGCQQIYASMALASEATMQRTAAILEDARFPTERSQVCMLQHGSALAVSRRSAMPVTPPRNGTDLLQRLGLFSSRSNWRALAAEGKLSHARGVRGHDDGTGVDAEQSLTASFNALQDSIQTHGSEDLQTSREEYHNIAIQRVASFARGDIERSSRISSRVHAALHVVDAHQASTAGLALKDNMHLRETPNLAASSNGSAASSGEAFSLLSLTFPRVNGSKHSIGTEGHATVTAKSLRDSMGSSLDSLASSRISLVDAESALAASFNALQESIDIHPPMVLPASPSRSSGIKHPPAWISSGDAMGASVPRNGTGTQNQVEVFFGREDTSRSSKRASLVNNSRHIMDAEASLTSSFTALKNTINTNRPLVLQSAPTTNSVAKDPGNNTYYRGAAAKTPKQNERPSNSTQQGMGAETDLKSNFSSLRATEQTYYALSMLASTSRGSGGKTETASSSHVGFVDKPFRGHPRQLTSVHFSDRQAALNSSFNALQDNIMKHAGLSSSAALKESSVARADSKLGGSSQGLSLENISMHLVGADDAMMYHPSGLPLSRSRQSIKGALARKHIKETTRGAALVNGSSPSIDAENALKASFVALQNSIKIQHSLKWEHLDLQRKAKAAEWEATQTKAADERMLQQDMLIRQEDMRLRRQDEGLRAENNQLQQLVSQLTKADSEGKQVQQSSLASAWADGAPEMSLLLSALLESQAIHTEVAENNSERPVDQATSALKNRTSNKTLAAIRSSGSGNAGSRDARTERAIILGAGAAGLFLAWIISNAASFFWYHAKDENGDGVVDFDDFEEHMAHRVCCGLGTSGAKGIFGVVIIAAAGFAFLWWQGIIQPFLKELLCYVYLGAVLLLLVGVLLAELWGTFKDVFLTQIHALQRLMRFFKIETGDINFDKHVARGGKDGNADSDNPRSNFSCC